MDESIIKGLKDDMKSSLAKFRQWVRFSGASSKAASVGSMGSVGCGPSNHVLSMKCSTRKYKSMLTPSQEDKSSSPSSEGLDGVDQLAGTRSKSRKCV